MLTALAVGKPSNFPTEFRMELEKLCEVEYVSPECVLHGEMRGQILIVNLYDAGNLSFIQKAKDSELFEQPDLLCIYLTSYIRKKSYFMNLGASIYRLHYRRDKPAPGYALLSLHDADWANQVLRRIQGYCQGCAR